MSDVTDIKYHFNQKHMNAIDKISMALIRERGRDIKSFKGTRRFRDDVNVRAAVAYILRTDHHFTLQMIGKQFNRDHSTILHLLNKVDDWMKMPRQYFEELSLIARLRENEPTEVDMLLSVMNFWNSVNTKGEGFLCVYNGMTDIKTGFLIPASSSKVVTLNEFSKSSKEVNSFIKRHAKMLLKDGHFLRARVIDRNVEMSIMEFFEDFEDAKDAALEYRIRTIYNAITKTDEDI